MLPDPVGTAIRVSLWTHKYAPQAIQWLDGRLPKKLIFLVFAAVFAGLACFQLFVYSFSVPVFQPILEAAAFFNFVFALLMCGVAGSVTLADVIHKRLTRTPTNRIG